ncbi:MAG TPA: hypothetical protein VGA38_08730 [Candidatus Limnocylindria bacterium]
MRKLPAKGPLALGIAVALTAACASMPPEPKTRSAPTAFVIPTELPNGRVEITVATAYPLGANAAIPVTVIVTRGTVTGPVRASIVASGINEGGKPAEALVRELSAPSQAAGTGRRSFTLTWDTRDATGAIVPADAYVIALEFRIDDAGTARTVTATATLELR